MRGLLGRVLTAARRKEPAAYGKQAGFTTASLDLAECEAVFVALVTRRASVRDGYDAHFDGRTADDSDSAKPAVRPQEQRKHAAAVIRQSGGGPQEAYGIVKEPDCLE